MDFTQPVSMRFIALTVGAIVLLIAVGVGLVFRAKKVMTEEN